MYLLRVEAKHEILRRVSAVDMLTSLAYDSDSRR